MNLRIENMSELELKNGKTFVFIDQYETVEAKISYGKTLEGYNAFKIWFNGKFVIISKTFIPIVHKLNELADRYQLEESKFK
jgi:hypothetical protein